MNRERKQEGEPGKSRPDPSPANISKKVMQRPGIGGPYIKQILQEVSVWE
jgi:hypothetical protein